MAEGEFSHRLISSVYSTLQANRSELGYAVSKIVEDETAGCFILAQRPLDHTSQYAFFKALGHSDVENFSSFLDTFMSVPLSFEPDQVEKIAVIDDKDSETVLSSSISSTSYNLVIWSVSQVEGRIRKIYGNHLNSSTDRIMTSGLYFPEIYPFPYYEFMHPLLKFEVFNMGFSIKGKQSLRQVLDAATEMAYYYSVGYERQRIRGDLSDLVRSMIRMGIVSGKAETVNLPSSLSSFTENFIRKYASYIERASKKTIFDFESLI